ncbi:MAG: methyltransferase [Acholeplasmatales bacterium]|jgi:tRNA1(Val) A37 N6-methylase TrmN6|nr:methyltransferase [Acholeplasmatales bacterium]
MKRELLNSHLIYNFDVDEEFNIDTLLLKDFVHFPHKVVNVLEIGAGAGAIALYLSQNRQLKISAIEIQETRYQRLVENIEVNQLEEQITAVFGDVKHYNFVNRFDAIVTNPPFYKVSSKNFNGNFQRRIAKEEVCLNLEQLTLAIKNNLRDLGLVYLIYPTTRLIELISTFSAHQLVIKRLKLVAISPHEAPSRALIEAVKGAKHNLKFEPTIYLYNEDHTLSPELKKIYGDEK